MEGPPPAYEEVVGGTTGDVEDGERDGRERPRAAPASTIKRRQVACGRWSRLCLGLTLAPLLLSTGFYLGLHVGRREVQEGHLGRISTTLAGLNTTIGRMDRRLAKVHNLTRRVQEVQEARKGQGVRGGHEVSQGGGASGAGCGIYSVLLITSTCLASMAK